MKERNKKIFLISTFLRSVSEIRIFFCLLLIWNWSLCFSNEDAKRVFFFESITATWVFVGENSRWVMEILDLFEKVGPPLGKNSNGARSLDCACFSFGKQGDKKGKFSFLF